MSVEFQTVEPLLEANDGHLHEVGDAAAADLYIVGFGLQTGAVTDGTIRLSPVAGKHHAVLDLILIILQHLEELVDARFLLRVLIGRKSVPQPVFLSLGEVHVGFEDGEIIVGGMTDEPLLPLFHLIPVPADDTAVIDGERGVGDDQFLVDTDDASEALTLGTGACGRVEGEHLVVGLLEGDAVGLETHGEIVEDRWREEQAEFAVALEEGCLGGVHEARDGVFGIIGREAVDDEVDIIGITRIS